MAQWLTIKHFRRFTILHTKTLVILLLAVVALDVIRFNGL